MNLKLKQFIDVYIGRFALFFHLIAVRFLGVILNRNHSINRAPKNIVIIKILGLGSVLMATDAIYSLKLKYPNAKLTLICGKGVSIGIEPLNLFDQIWVIDDKNVFVLFKTALQTLLKTWKLKNIWVADLEVYSILTTLFSAWTFAINRYGFQLDKTHFRNYLNTHNIYLNQFILVTTNYEKLVESMGVSEITIFHFPQSIRPIEKKENTIFINNTCSELGGNLRKLTPEILTQICNYIIDSTSYKIAFVGAPSDKHEIDKFLNINQLNVERVENIAGRFNFKEYYNYLAIHAKCMLSIDSAPLHIANKLNIPSVSFWGPINPSQRLKDTKNAYYIEKACSPCIHHTEMIPCGGNNVCMKDMEIKHIITLINSIINNE